MADIDLNLYLHSEKFTTALKAAGVDVDKFYADWKLSQEEQIIAQQKLIASTEALRKKNEEIQKQMNAGKGKYGELLREMGKNKDQILQNEIALEGMAKAEKTVGTETTKTAEKVKKSEKVQRSYTTTMRAVRTAIALAAAALGVFRLIMEATNTTANELQTALRTVGAVAKELLRAVGDKNWKNLGERFKDAVKRGKEYAQSMQMIQAQQLKSNATIDNLNLKIAEYKDILEDTTIGEKERQNIQNEIFNMESQVASERVKLAQGILDTQLKNSKLSKQYTQTELENMLMLAPAYETNKIALEAYTMALRNPEREKNAKIIAETSKEVKDLAAGYIEWSLDGGKSMTELAKAHSDLRAAQIAQYGVSKETVDKDKESKSDQLKNQEEFNKSIEKLYDEYNKSNIDSLSGVEQINAIRDFNIKTINEEQTRLEKIGTLTEEQYKIFDALRQSEFNRAEKDTAEFHKQELEAERKANEEMLGEIEKAYGDQQALWDLEKDLEIQALELAGKDTETAMLEVEKRYLQRRITAITARINTETDFQKKLELEKIKELLQGEVAAVDKQVKAIDFNFWEAIGISDPDQQEKAKENLKIAVDTMVGVMDEIFANRVDDAQRNRDLIDEQIEYTTEALDREMELAKLGYANNVDAKKKELEDLKKAREKAIKEEEKAVKAQRAMDTVMQVTSLITASAQILKGTAKDPITLGIAIATIAAMFAAFGIAKASAAKATKLAEGGVGTEIGIIGGKSHQEGGEPFLNHVEVERGEMWGVLSKSAAAKHGKEFSQIVTSFNKDNLVVERVDAPNNYINVDVNQTNSRLDKVENQLIKLNRHFAGQKEVHETADVRIEKIGNKTRIIRK
jgi:hypothetical protein